ATIVSTFSLASGIAAFVCGFLPRSLPIRYPLALVGLFLTVGTLLMIAISNDTDGFVAGATFGFGIGGLLTLLPLAWADYFGRANLPRSAASRCPRRCWRRRQDRCFRVRCTTGPAITCARCNASPCCRRSACWRRCWRDGP